MSLWIDTNIDCECMRMSWVQGYKSKLIKLRSLEDDCTRDSLDKLSGVWAKIFLILPWTLLSYYYDLSDWCGKLTDFWEYLEISSHFHTASEIKLVEIHVNELSWNMMYLMKINKIAKLVYLDSYLSSWLKVREKRSWVYCNRWSQSTLC